MMLRNDSESTVEMGNVQGWNFSVAMAVIAPLFGLDAPWKKSSYAHSGLFAPGPVSIVSLPWITASRVHSSHSQ